MLTKSLIIASIVFNLVGLHGMADKFDSAIVREQSGSEKVAVAGNLNAFLPEILPRPKIKSDSPKGIANARHYLLADPESGAIILDHDANAKVPIASTTKIMTAAVVLENYKLDDIVTISGTAAFQPGADAYLRVGEQITVENLLNCMLIKSGNDSAYALAEHMNNYNETGIAKFVKTMNQKAEELGMEDTQYNDPAGLDVTGYSSAHDLFIITKYILENETFSTIVKKDHEVVKDITGTTWHDLPNSNRLVNEYHYDGAIGVKTGYMPEAGHCLVGAATRDGHTLIVIILSTYIDSNSASADESKRLLDWGFSNLTWE